MVGEKKEVRNRWEGLGKEIKAGRTIEKEDKLRKQRGRDAGGGRAAEDGRGDTSGKRQNERKRKAEDTLKDE